MSLDASWAPWESVQNASRAPFVRWFCGASTNAAFNEVDRHLLSSSVGQPAMAAAFLPEPVGDHPQMPMSRQQLLVHSVLAAHALRDGLKLPLGARVAVYMPNRPEVRAVCAIAWHVHASASYTRVASLLARNDAPTLIRLA